MTAGAWPRLRVALEEELDGDEYATWIKPLAARSEGPDALVLLAPSQAFFEALGDGYRSTIERAAERLSPRVRVSFGVGADARGGSAAPTAALAPPGARFNPAYTFESFVVGSSNQFAHAAARAVAESPSHSYNPLFLYGGVGLGKTHLLHAIGHQILRRNPDLRVAYLAAEQFVNELISSIRFDRMPAFRERYRRIDVLLVDDVQFLANKERTQEEFFHTFNTLYSTQKQIILTSDAPPRDIQTLEERLRSRFEWGLIADIQPPDIETKVVILRRRAEREGVALPDDVAAFIARGKTNIRELEGLLTRVLAFSSLTGQPLSIDLARETLKDIVGQDRRNVSPADVIKFVARHYGLKVSEIKSKTNSKQVVFPRQVAMYLLKKVTPLSFPDIGKQFGDKHHSTVMHSVEKIDHLRATDSDFEHTLKGMQDHFS
jgi:chromosomal replication initiator protein